MLMFLCRNKETEIQIKSKAVRMKLPVLENTYVPKFSVYQKVFFVPVGRHYSKD